MLRFRGCFGGVLVVVLIAWAGIAASLEISVHGESEIFVEVVSAGTTIVVDGRLVDDQGEALAARKIELVVEPRDAGGELRREVDTDFYGYFSSDFEVPPGRYSITAEYAGSSHVTATSVTRRILVESMPPEVEVQVPSWVHGAKTSVPVEIAATAGGQPLPARAAVTVDGAYVGSVQLGRDGKANLDLGSLVAAGTRELGVEIGPTEFRPGGATRRTVRRAIDVHLEGQTERVFQRLVRGTEVLIRVVDENGPIPGVSVGVVLTRVGDANAPTGAEGPEQLVRQIVTGDDGRASALFADGELGDGSWKVSARVEPPLGPGITWEGGNVESEAWRYLWLVQVIGLLVLTLGILWLGRRAVVLVMEKWKDWIRGLKRDDGSEVDSGDEEVFVAVDEVELERVLEGSDEAWEEIEIQAWDEWDERPVVDASIFSVPQNGQRDKLSGDERGMVKLEGTRSESMVVQAEAPGFVPARARLEFPATRGVYRIRMTPVPLKIRRAYRTMIRRVGGVDQWGRLTPRQIEDILRGVGGSSPTDGDGSLIAAWRTVLDGWGDLDEEDRFEALVGAITALVEETNFSGQIYERQVWNAAREAMEAFIEVAREDVDEGRGEGA